MNETKWRVGDVVVIWSEEISFSRKGTRARTPTILIYVQACVGMAVTRRTEAKKRCAISPPIAIRHFASTPQIDGVRRSVVDTRGRSFASPRRGVRARARVIASRTWGGRVHR